MKLRFYFLFFFFTLLFLFYPGDSSYFHMFAYHRPIFLSTKQVAKIFHQPVPVVKTSTYPDLTAEGIYIVDIPSFTPLYERNMQQQFLPASTTKVITALVTYDLFDPDNIVTVNRVITEGQTMGLTVGEKITVENLLYGILVHSGNDAAYALADHYGYEKFIEAMNQKAKQLGMNNTHFKNPAGLDDYEQYTTPFDMTLAARELLKNKMLSKIVSTRDITVADSQFINFHRLSNVNKLLGEVHGIGGLKTGYTDNAGENLISLYKSNGYQYIITILKSRDRFADTKAVVKWLNGNVEYIKL